MAVRLDRTFGGGAETWRRLQKTYDTAQAALPSGGGFKLLFARSSS